MVKVKSIITVVVLLISVCCVADTETVNGITWTYKVSNGEVSIGGGSLTSLAVPQATSGAITIPSILGGKPVTSIGDYAFYSCSGLTSVTIPDSVTSIGEDTFSRCGSLTNVTIPGSVTSIGKNAFSYCISMVSVAIPAGVANISERMLYDCNSLTSIKIPYGVTNIGHYAFSGCSKLTSVAMPDSVKSIDYGAFWGCIGLKSITIPDSVKSIGGAVFSGCSGLAHVTIPDGVADIGALAFDDTQFYKNQPNGLVILGRVMYKFKGDCPADVLIPYGVTSISPSAFGTCRDLMNITIPNSVKSIGSQAFRDCISLTNVVIPDGVATVELGVFNNCTNLSSVTLPNSIRSIGWSAFNSCRSLKTITLPNCVTNIGATAFALSGLTNVTIPDSVTSIEYMAFGSCSNLTSVIMPNSIMTIKYHAFEDCLRLPSITIPDSVTNIAEYALSGCSGLTNVLIGCGVKSIGKQAFSGCKNLRRVTIPVNVGNIDTDAFKECSRPHIYLPTTYSGAIPSNVKIVLYKPEQTVTFDVPSGMTAPDTIVAVYGTAYASLPSLSRPGYLFQGWALDGEDVGEDTLVSALDDHTLVAQWTPIQYMMTFDANGGVGGTSGNQDFDSVIVAPTVTRTGYTFVGWSPSVPATVPLGGATYVAQWEVNQYAVTFDANGGVGGTSSRQDYGTEIVAPTVTRTGYTFKGWLPSVVATVPANDVTYAAQWEINKYAVTFDANGGEGGTSGSQDYGTAIVAPTVTRTGYTFKGWSPAVAATVPANDVTYRARWEINKYTVTFNANGGTGGTSGSQNYGMAITPPTVARTGYTFAGWSPGVAATVPANDVTYTAQWTPNAYAVTFDANGGIGGWSRNLDYDSAIVAPTVTRTGYTFKGWSPSVPTTVPLGGATYTAQWQINQYTVTFNANGGVGGKSTKQDYGTAIVTPTVTRTGYTFKGWSPSVMATVPAYNVTYTAQWEINKYTVTFDANGGTCETEAATVEHGAAIGVLPVPTRTQAAFLGWFNESGVRVDELTTVTCAVTLYAHWLTEVANPVVTTDWGSLVFRTNSCVVSISCVTDGALIYYTDDGTTPKKNDNYLYAGPFTITDTTTIKAVAVIGDVQSEYVTVTITKKLLSLEEALDVEDGVSVAASATLPWRPIFDADAKVGDATARSGAIGDRTNTWLSATVSGAGTMSFWCKVSCEHDDDNTFTWDRLMVYTNDVEVVEWRMDGETDWTRREVSFAGGENTVKWVYFKDRSISEGEDCAWVDGVTWTLADVAVDVGGGKSVLVPMDWIDAHSNIVMAVGGDKSAAMKSTAANGRKVWECYVLGLDPEKTADFKITSFPMKSDGTPDLSAITFEPEQNQWNLSGAVPKLKGKVTLDAEWQDVPPGGNPSFRFFTVEVQMP